MFKRILAMPAAGLALMLALTLPGESRAAEDAIDQTITITPRLSQRIVKSGETSRIYLRLGIKVARLESVRSRAPLNIALVIDRSGSMQGARIEGARNAAMMAINRLSPRDIVSVVSYDDRVEVEVPATRATDPDRIKDRIRRLTPRGSTAIHAGMLAGLEEIRKFKSRDMINRIILLSDGLANVGPSSPEHFARLGREIAGEGITVSTIGLGLGYNEDLMSKLAINADGSHVFVQEPADLTAFLNREIDDIQGIYAQDIDVTIELKHHVRPIRSLGRDAEIKADRISWRLAQLGGGSEHVLLAELETPADLALEARDIARVRIAYRTVATGQTVERIETVPLGTSAIATDIESAIDPDVMRDATLLTAREKKDQAIRLRDAGKVEEARKAFEQNAIDITDKATRYNFKVDDQMSQEQAANRAAASPAANSADGWSKQRKVLREQDANTSGASRKY